MSGIILVAIALGHLPYHPRDESRRTRRVMAGDVSTCEISQVTGILKSLSLRENVSRG